MSEHIMLDEDQEDLEIIEQARVVAEEEERTLVAEEVPVPVPEEEEYGADEMPPEKLEEIKAESKAPEVKDNIPDLSDTLMLVPISPEELEEVFVKADMTPEALAVAEGTNNKFYRLAKIYSTLTKASRFNLMSMEGKDLHPVSEVCSDKLSRGKKFDKNKMLEGEEAVINISARLHGLKKIYLYNSGFHIVVKKIGSMEIKNILDYIDENGVELGRSLGGHFYAMNDIFFVQQVGYLLKQLVVDSNLRKWDHGNNLIKFISINDFPSILGGIASLLFKEGVKYAIECPEVTCDYQEKLVLDVDKLKLVDMQKLGQPAIKRLLSDDEFTAKDYIEYQEAIGAHSEVQINPTTKFELKVPTIFTFVKNGVDLMSKIIEALYADNRTPSNDDILEYRILNYYKSFISWINRAVLYNEDGTLDITTREKKALEDMLEPSIWENHDERDKFVKFFTDSRIVHHGVLGTTCPKCGKTPNPKTNGFMSLDMHSFFFNLSAYRMLESLGS